MAIIGGGIGGLSAAYFAQKRGYSVELHERTDQLGGLAASFDFDGLTIEKFYHFICSGDSELLRFSEELGIAHKVKFLPTKTSFFYMGKYYPFGTPLDLLRFEPIPFISRLRFGYNAATARFLKKWEKLDRLSAKEWLERNIGPKAYEVIWNPLLRVKFGYSYEQISAAWMWHRIHRVTSSRKSLFSKERMGYFVGGSQTLISEMERKIRDRGGQIFLNSNILGIEKRDSGFSLRTSSKIRSNYDRVVLTVPLPVAAGLLKDMDSEFARRLSRIDFIGVVCGVFRLRRRVTDAFWLNINDPRIAANGFIEYTNLNHLKEISPHKIIYIPFYAPLEDRWFGMDERLAMKEYFSMLKIVNPGLSEEHIVGFRVFRSPYAQAVCTVGFKNAVPPIKLPLGNLFLLDSTQLYPSDRTLSGMVGLAKSMIDSHF